jgi:hypothetical protein
VIRFWEHAFGLKSGASPGAAIAPGAAAPPEEPFGATIEEAQDWCNFVVLRPDWLPSDCRLAQMTARAESERHPSSLRLTIEGHARSMRLKQFFMDWWIPTSSDSNLTAPGRAFTAAGIVGYLGRDYKGREAACIHRCGTLLELSVAHGQFSDQEIGAFFEGLQPAMPEAVEHIAALPFAKVSYYARKGPSPGPWNYDLLTGCRWTAAPNAFAPKDTNELNAALEQFDSSRVYFPQKLPPRFAFDSVGTRIEPSIQHWEYQLLFRHRDNLTDNIWLRAVGEETERILWISPGLDRRMGIRLEGVQLARRKVRMGSTSEPYGERVAQWAENGIAFEVHARASLHIRAEDFKALLDSLSPRSATS